MQLKSLFLVPFLVVSCGESNNVFHSSKGKSYECTDEMNLVSNCSAIVTPTPAPTATPLPTPVPPAFGLLKFKGAEFFSTSQTLTAKVHVVGGNPGSWQTLGVSNAAPVYKTVNTNMTQAGHCVQVGAKVVNGHQTYTNTGHPAKFQYCLDGNDVLIKFEDGTDNDFNDYIIRVSSPAGHALNYQLSGHVLSICVQ